MKHHTCLLLALTIVVVGLCTSCYSFSLYPWFGDAVKVFEPGLLGKWGDRDDYVAVKRGPDETYELVFVEPDEKRARLRGRLGRIDDEYYLDVVWESRPEDPDTPEWLYGVHMLAKVELEEDRVWFTALDIEKLERLRPSGLKFVEVGDKSRYDGTDGVLITSSTSDLQRFLEKHGSTSNIWLTSQEDGGWVPRR
jgi:hypothetical protein